MSEKRTVNQKIEDLRNEADMLISAFGHEIDSTLMLTKTSDKVNLKGKADHAKRLVTIAERSLQMAKGAYETARLADELEEAFRAGRDAK